MAKKDDLKSFKIADKKRPTIASRGGGGGGAKKDKGGGEAPSTGFARIESFLDSGNDELVGQMKQTHEQLVKLRDSVDRKQKLALERAIAAYERTFDLLDHLVGVKENMSNAQ